MSGRLQFAAAFTLLAAFSAGTDAQDLQFPPGVLLLSRIKRHVRSELDRLPEYTCLETIERSIKDPNKDPKHTGKTAPLDTVRLEVLYSGGKEWYASPGAGDFRESSPAAFIGGGMIGDGIFATHIHSVFASETPIFTWRGEESVARERGWAQAVKYDFRISPSLSGWRITLPHASGIVGSRGTFWADPESYELLRIEIHADDIPPELQLSDVTITSDYGRMRIGSGDVMLPQAADIRMVQTNGQEALDQFNFTHCRSYAAESSVTFGAAEPTAAEAPRPATPPPHVAESLPPGLTVPVTLTSPVRGDAAVGSLLEGRVSGAVSLKGKTLIPEGATLRGRIRQLARYDDIGPYFVVGLEFTEIETSGKLFRFYADLLSASGAPGLEWTLSTAHEGRFQSITEKVRAPDLPGVGSFFVRGTKLSLPAGFRMEWRTRSLR